jgi:hypothetical protein
MMQFLRELVAEGGYSGLGLWMTPGGRSMMLRKEPTKE